MGGGGSHRTDCFSSAVTHTSAATNNDVMEYVMKEINDQFTRIPVSVSINTCATLQLYNSTTLSDCRKSDFLIKPVEVSCDVEKPIEIRSNQKRDFLPITGRI